MPGSRRSILIIDDSLEDSVTFKRYLNQDPAHELTFFEEVSAEQAVDTILKVKPDCVLLDYYMPDGTGLDVLHQLKALGFAGKFAVIMLTGTGSETIAVDALKSGASDYLVKARTTPESLRVAVNSAIYKAETQRLLEAQRLELERLYSEARENMVKKDQLLSELRVAKDAAEHANAAKDQFLATLSHELRTPLTPILTAVSSLELGSDVPQEFADAVTIIRRSVELEARLIDDLLDLTRISKGKLQLEPRPIDLHQIIHDTVAIKRQDIADKQLTLALDLHANRYQVMGDPARLQQVLWNLINNAAKFTPAGGSIQICSSTSHDESRVIVSVRDSGVGIDPERLPVIFDAFEQGGRAVTRQYGGLGLGLTISKALLLAHGGAISAYSKGKGTGAEFSIELATVAPDLPQPDTGSQPVVESTNGQESLKVMLVEDHHDSATLLERALSRKGFQVISANTVSSGIQLFSNNEVDVVISDLGLPDGTGIDLLTKIQSIRPVRAIALSGFGMEADIRRSKEAGFAEHLTKPVDFNRLISAIRRLNPKA